MPEPMERPHTLRLPAEHLDRAKRLAERMRHLGHYCQRSGRDMTRSTVLRLAVDLGLDALEIEHGLARRRRR